MADIAARFFKDMLVLSAPLETALAAAGVDVERDLEYISLVEPDTVRDALRLQMAAGAQCVVTNTAGITPARLAHHRMENSVLELAVSALTVAKAANPQHILAEIGPCGLPLDPSSKFSVKECKDQYMRAARAFGDEGFDAFFLNGFCNVASLKCALMGLRQVSDLPIFASIKVNGEGISKGDGITIEEAAAFLEEYGASVAGFETAAPIDEAAAVCERAVGACSIPVLVQLAVGQVNPKQGGATAENPYFCADTMVEAAERIWQSGGQFVRATGAATPAYTGALAAYLSGLDVIV